jgi:hypothetical protein
MNWQTILKQPKLRTGSKITTNLGTDSKLEDNDCLKKVLEYLDKMRNFRPVELVTELVTEFPDHWVTHDSSNANYFLYYNPFECKEYGSFLCNEKVACVVLKLLERLKSQGSGLFWENVQDGNEIYGVDVFLESTKKLKTREWDQWFDDHQDAAFVILIEGSDFAEFYQMTYESYPKNPDRNPIGYKDYTEEDYKRMIEVLHKGVFG